MREVISKSDPDPAKIMAARIDGFSVDTRLLLISLVVAQPEGGGLWTVPEMQKALTTYSAMKGIEYRDLEAVRTLAINLNCAAALTGGRKTYGRQVDHNAVR